MDCLTGRWDGGWENRKKDWGSGDDRGERSTTDSLSSTLVQLYTDLKNDVFRRFRSSDVAENLVRSNPLLAVGDPATAFNDAQVQLELHRLMDAAIGVAKYDRMTAFLVHDSHIYSVCSSKLGSAIMKIPKGVGFAGKAAESGEDILVDDASGYSDSDCPADRITGYMTKSILCVVLKRADVVQAVVQLLNKVLEDAPESTQPFTQHDATRVRLSIGPALLNVFEDVALHNVGSSRR